jgi:drug/metabolite transporter (DMT)-like permease
MKRTPFAIVLAAYTLACVAWGHSSFVSRLTMQGYPSFVAGALRMTCAAFVAFLIWRLADGKLERIRQAWRGMVLAGIMNGFALAGTYWALRSLTGGLVTTVLALQPVTVTILGCFFLPKRSSSLNLVGALVALAGIGLIYVERMQLSHEQGLAIVVLCASAVLLGASYFPLNSAREVSKSGRLMLVFVPMAITLWACAAADSESYAWLHSMTLPVGATIGVAYLGVVGMVLPFLAFFLVLNEWGEVKAATMDFMIPIMALGTDVLFEAEPMKLSALGLLGVAFVLAGVALSLSRKPITVENTEAVGAS